MRVLVLSQDFYDTDRDVRLARGESPLVGGGLYYRLVLPTVALNGAGHHCFLCPKHVTAPDGSIVGKAWLPGENGEQFVPDADVVITQRWMRRGAKEATLRARAAGQLILADVDDHYWALPSDNAAFIGTHPRYQPNQNRDHYWAQLGACDAVIVSTPELARYCSRLDVPVYLRRNMIDLELWKWRDTTLADRKPRIGWTGGTLWRKRDLTHAPGGTLGWFTDEHDLTFAHVGHRDDSPSAARLFGIDEERVGYRVHQTAFDSFADEVAAAEIDLGVVPLEDHAFNRAKSCLKGMEFAAAGIPYVASKLPEYEWFGQGLLVRKPREWKNALERLIEPEERGKIATAALERVRLEDYRVRGQDYVTMLEELL